VKISPHPASDEGKLIFDALKYRLRKTSIVVNKAALAIGTNLRLKDSVALSFRIILLCSTSLTSDLEDRTDNAFEIRLLDVLFP